MKKSFYDVLQVPQDADQETIESVYQLKVSELEQKFDESSQNELKNLRWAYETLIDQDSRSVYDKKLSKYSQDSVSNVSGETPAGSIFLGWWASRKLSVTLAALAILVGVYLVLDYKRDANKTAVSELAIIEHSKNDTARIANESAYVAGSLANQKEAIGTVGRIAEQEQERRRVELEYQANAGTQILEMERQRQEQMLELQKQRFEMEKKRQEEMLELQRKRDEDYRIRRQLQYYSCYNAAWDRYGGDGTRAAASCAMYK